VILRKYEKKKVETKNIKETEMDLESSYQELIRILQEAVEKVLEEGKEKIIRKKKREKGAIRMTQNMMELKL